MRPARLNIVYEDADILVINKPAGLLTSTVPRERRPTLLAMVREYLQSTDRRVRVGLIHRLDRDAAGLLVFSKNDAAYQSLKSQLFHRTMKRVYSAVVVGVLQPPKGRIESRLVELPTGKVRSTKQHGKGEVAITDYEVLKSHNGRSLLRVSLHTGRKHQIRAHLSEKGHPIIGDPVYGPNTLKSPRLLLAATELSFDHPRTGKPAHFTIDLPHGFRI